MEYLIAFVLSFGGSMVVLLIDRLIPRKEQKKSPVRQDKSSL